MADVVLNPKFDQKELDLLKSQTLDELTYNLKQPNFLASYVASKFSFGEHPADGTPASLNSITMADMTGFHSKYYLPASSVIIFAGDISSSEAMSSTQKYFGKWEGMLNSGSGSGGFHSARSTPDVSRILVVDLPNSGQAAVSYFKSISDVPRMSADFYPASVMNSVLGGGYSSRLNEEIRIKRGLSYGAGSSFSWRNSKTNFSTRTQTKNESAAEVVELVIAELKKLTSDPVASDELVPRKSVLTGNFGRNLETTAGLASAIGELYSFGIPASELNRYMTSVNAVTDAQIRDFASKNLLGGDIIIAGDYSVFKDDLAKRFPNMKVLVMKATGLGVRPADSEK
jgi:zinc protease